jgi:hypothetical protein
MSKLQEKVKDPSVCTSPLLLKILYFPGFIMITVAILAHRNPARIETKYPVCLSR